MVECPVCKSKTGLVCWTEIVKNKKTGKAMSVSLFVPINENDGTVALDRILAIYPEENYWTYSFNSEHFRCEEMKGVETGAHCIKCNADI